MTASNDPARRLLSWYDKHRRVLPWRAPAGTTADPYHVWLSEIMLQQTTVQAVAGYYRKFLSRWPTVEALAAAPLDEVLAAWAGLGYYARARNLHKCAAVVARELGGVFPDTAEALRRLPGVGPYTAGAIAAIAFDRREAAMDANAERVVARLFAMDEPFPGGKVRLRALGQGLVPAKRAGDFAQALMDLGSAICTVKRPACGNCPLAEGCAAQTKGIAESLPVKAPKAVRPLRRGAAFVAVNGDGAVLLEKRPDKGLLASMMQPPQTEWGPDFPERNAVLTAAPFAADWKKLPGVVRHGFTHFELELEVWTTSCHPRLNAAKGRGPRSSGLKSTKKIAPADSVKAAKEPPPGSPSLGLLSSFAAEQSSPGMTNKFWVPLDRLSDVALPTVMKKILSHALPDDGPLFARG